MRILCFFFVNNVTYPYTAIRPMNWRKATERTNTMLLLVIAEVECEVSSQVEYSLQAIWGVSIRELHLALWKPWSSLRDASLNGTLLQEHAQFFTSPQAYPFLIVLSLFALGSQKPRSSAFYPRLRAPRDTLIYRGF